MSRITKDQNQWGAGDLNGAPSAVKTNGEHVKRYGPLGIGGIGGVMKRNGNIHQLNFEIHGDEILTENGVNATEVLRTHLADNVGRFIGGEIIVEEAFTALDVVSVWLDPVSGAAAELLNWAVDAVGVVLLTETDLLAPTEWDNDGASAYFDFTGLTAGPGKAHVTLNFRAL